jgi:hypothetical protein
MEYLFLDDFNLNNYDKIKDKKNVMVIYGERITELVNELNRSKDSISDFQFILKSRNGRSNKQKYISVNRDSLQVKERVVEEEIEKKKKQIQKEKDKQAQTQNYVRLVTNENKEKKKKEEQIKIEKEHENLITEGIFNIIQLPISDNSNLYQVINNIDLNRIDVEEPSKPKELTKPQPKKKINTPASTTTYSPSVSPAWSPTTSAPSSRSSSASSSASSTPSIVSSSISPQHQY